ncbi:hypothetical protein [Staphylococcus auricularis]|uniref:hypothetical protein n=1 Tax=Staphylococcus auricularis TaxID=29379 RepID=UPI0017814335
MDEDLDGVVRIGRKGIWLGNGVGGVLNLGVVVIGKDKKVSEGWRVWIKYV